MHFHRGALLALALGAWATGCARDPDVLARVGTRTVTLQDLESAMGGGPGVPFASDSARRHLLNDLVSRALLVEAARTIGLEREPGYNASVRGAEVPLLTDALFRDEAGGGIRVSDSEVAELYRLRGQETHVRIMFLLDRSDAERALSEVRAGRSFAEVADRHNVAGVLPPGGDVGFIPPGTLEPALDRDLRTRPPGWVSGVVPVPVKSFLILQVLERRPRAQPPLEQQAQGLREMILQRKRSVTALATLDRLRRSYEVTPVPGGSQFLFRKLESVRAPSLFGNQGVPRLPEMSVAELARPLVRWRGGFYRVADALGDLQTTQQRPSLARLPQLEDFLQTQALQRVVVMEARRRGLHLRPEVGRRIQSRADDWLAGTFYQRAVEPRAQVSQEEVVTAYQRRAAEFRRIEQARVRYVITSDSLLAARLAAAPIAAPGGSPSPGGGLAARAPKLGVRFQESLIRPSADDPTWGLFQDLFFTLRPGEVAGPFAKRGGWLVFEVLATKQGVPRFDQLQVYEQRMVLGDALQHARAAVLDSLLDSLRASIHPYEVHPERLKGVTVARDGAT